MYTVPQSTSKIAWIFGNTRKSKNTVKSGNTGKSGNTEKSKNTLKSGNTGNSFEIPYLVDFLVLLMIISINNT